MSPNPLVSALSGRPRVLLAVALGLTVLTLGQCRHAVQNPPAAAPMATTSAPTPPPIAAPTPVASAPAAPTPALDPIAASNLVSDIAERAVQSVVNISTTRIVRQRSAAIDEPAFRGFFGDPEERSRRENSLGSGVIVGDDGIVVTNNHVIEQASEIQVKLADGRIFEAKLAGADPRSDIAVLRLQGKVEGLQTLALADSDRLRLGETVLAIGSPFGLAQTVTQGIVSAKGRADMRIVDYEDFIQTDAAINPGNSGGALVNLRGELVGINTAILSRTGGNQGIGFSIPTNMVRPIMSALIKNGRVSRGWLGVGIQDLDTELQQAFGSAKGVLVSEVQPGSPADKSGLMRGDIVTKVDTTTVDTSGRLRNLVASHEAGTHIKVEFVRAGKALTVPVVLGQQPGTQAAQRGTEEAGAAIAGLQVAPLSPQLRRGLRLPPQLQGLVVVDVTEDCPADKAGLRRGDLLLEVNHHPVVSVDELARAAQGGRVLLFVLRNGHSRYALLQP
jgi:serine protease Do